MTWSIDHVIFLSFLILIIIFGLKSSTGINTIKQYAIGDGNFNTATIVATTVATWMCGETFFSTITETYQHGLYFLLPCILAFVMNFFITGYFIAPRIASFIGKVSIAEVMGELYGQKVRLITTISGFIGVSGFIAVQLKISGILVNYVFGLHETYGIVISGLIITLYSSLGGIKSVTFTDVIQIFTFGTILPMVTIKVIFSLDSTDAIIHTLENNPNFSLSKVLSFSETKTWYYASIFLFCLIPCFNPAEFQRVSMAKDYKQVRTVFYTTGKLVFLIMSLIAYLSLVILSKDPNIPVENLVKDHIFSTAIIGYKGLLLIGITAMVMSTADSYINCSSVLFTYDFCKCLNIKLKDELTSARIISFIVGLSGIALAFKESSLFHLAIFTASFYTPIVAVPFLMAILGYKTPYEKAVLYGMASGLIVVLLWNYLDITIIDSIVPAVFANWLVLLVMHKHYYFKEQTTLVDKSAS